MKQRAFAWLAVFALALAGLRAYAVEYATPAEAQALVKKAIAYYQKNGKDKALAEFMRQGGPFIDRDLYVTVYTMDATCLAHINPKMIGKNMLDLRDPDGKFLIKERVDAAKMTTSGWQQYKFFNPVSKRIEPKRMYWEKHDGILFAAGAYTSD